MSGLSGCMSGVAIVEFMDPYDELGPLHIVMECGVERS